MSALSVQGPFPIITDTDGQPLEDGSIYIGVVNLNAITNPQTVYWDAALTQVATQPIRTRGGYPLNGAAPGRLYVANEYSIAVVNRIGAVVYTAPSPTERYSSSLLTFLQAGANAVPRSVQSKLRDVVSVKDFGAVGDGVTDDTAAFNAAFAAGTTVYCPWGIYLVKNIQIKTHETLLGNNSIFIPAPGATSIFTLTAFKPTIQDCYFDGSNGNLVASLGVNGAVVVIDSQFPTVKGCQFFNLNTGLVARVSAITSSTQVTQGNFSDLIFNTINTRGIYVGPNVNSCCFDNIQIYVGQVPSGNLAIPKAGCIGFQIVSTGTLTAAGGHFISKVAILESEIGFQFTDAQLTNLSQCIADSLMLSGYQCTGACQDIHFDNCFAGTCLLGFEISGTSTRIVIDGAETIFQGLVPPWGNPVGFFAAGSPYDIKLQNTSNTKIGDWFSDAYLFYADATITLSFTSEDQIYSGTTSTAAAATTVYLTPVGANSTETPTWLSPKKGIFLGFYAQCDTAPGAGESFTYTIRNQFSDLSSAIISGAGNFAATSTDLFTFNAQTNISFKLVTSASANAANHRIVGRVRYFG